MVWVAVGTAAASLVVGAVTSADSARRANNTQKDAIDAQSASAKDQLSLAQDQWDYQKSVYLPKSMQMADDAAAMNKQIAQKQMDAGDYYLGVSKDAVGQAKKSYKYQDQYMGMADKYANGSMANTMADEAQADTQQAGAQQRGITERALLRRGVDPGSGAGVAMMHDDQLSEAAAGAGAQTTARRMARDKAEQMVGIAAGAGQAGFGTGLNAGGLATGANNSASGASTVGNNTLNGVNNGYTAGMNGAGTRFAGAGNAGYNLGHTNSTSPYGTMIGSITSGAMRSGALPSWESIGTSVRGGLGTAGAIGDGSYAPNYGDEGRNYGMPSGSTDFEMPGTPQYGP